MTRPLRVLVVDDDRQAREQAEAGLVSLGYQVTGCPDDQKALALCLTGSYDAVLVDLRLLAARDMRLTRSLREHVPYKSLPVIGLVKDDDARVPVGSGLDLLVEAEADTQSWSNAIQRLRQQRGFLASSEGSPFMRHGS